MVPFIIGFIIGTLFGFIVFSVLSAARLDDEFSQHQPPKTGKDDGE